jgi:hypothetical protein
LDFAIIIFSRSKVVNPSPDPQPGGPGPCIYASQRQGGPVIPPGTGFPFRRLLGRAGYGGGILTPIAVYVIFKIKTYLEVGLWINLLHRNVGET